MVFEYRKISPGFASRRPFHFHCPVCNAPSGFLCISRKTGRPQRRAHVSREPQQNTSLPDLRVWWRAMRIYEGQHPRPRPAELTV